jgi:hypothetical protein
LTVGFMDWVQSGLVRRNFALRSESEACSLGAEHAVSARNSAAFAIAGDERESLLAIPRDPFRAVRAKPATGRILLQRRAGINAGASAARLAGRLSRAMIRCRAIAAKPEPLQALDGGMCNRPMAEPCCLPMPPL